MARIRRSKTNTVHFMDIPRSGLDNKRFKSQENATEGELWI